MCGVELRTELCNFCHDGYAGICMRSLSSNFGGKKAGEIKPISMTYHIKIDVNPFCFSDLHLLYGQLGSP